MRAALEGAPNMLMQLEAKNSAGAARCGCSEARTARLNGARMRQLREGSYCPSFLEPRRMSARLCSLPYRRLPKRRKHAESGEARGEPRH
jgi:hypothetical protein